MRYAIIADIHANLSAFTAVLEDIERRGGAAQYLCLGDTVSIGPDPHQCLDVLRGLHPVGIVGNHDLAVIGKLGIASFPSYLAPVLTWTMTQLTAEDVNYLAGLPTTVVTDGLTMVHGSPRDPVKEYLRTTEAAAECFAHFQTPLCFIGHSHLPLIFELAENGECLLRQPTADVPFPLTGNRYIINPGSAGQPRDGEPRASYAIYDSETRLFTIHRVPYDIAATQARIRACNLPERLATSLARAKLEPPPTPLAQEQDGGEPRSPEA